MKSALQNRWVCKNDAHGPGLHFYVGSGFQRCSQGPTLGRQNPEPTKDTVVFRGSASFTQALDPLQMTQCLTFVHGSFGALLSSEADICLIY